MSAKWRLETPSTVGVRTATWKLFLMTWPHCEKKTRGHSWHVWWFSLIGGIIATFDVPLVTLCSFLNKPIDHFISTDNTVEMRGIFVIGVWWSARKMARGEDVYGPSLLMEINITAFFPQECSGGIEIEQRFTKWRLLTRSPTRLLMLRRSWHYIKTSVIAGEQVSALGQWYPVFLWPPTCWYWATCMQTAHKRHLPNAHCQCHARGTQVL